MTLARIRFTLATACLTVLAASSASAQVFGTFSWQMQPYCNVVTLTLTQIPSGYTLDGFEDQCAGLKRASALGMVLLNPDGTIGLNFGIVTPPAGKAVHVAALINPITGSGTWSDSVGNSGTFVLAGAVPGLPARPLPTSGLGVAVITTTEIAPGAVGVTDINTAEVQTRVSGTCTAGQIMIGVNANGTVVCTGVAQSGQVLSGALSAVSPANATFALVHGSYSVPLPVGTATPTLEFRAAGTPSATCPGLGQAAAGRLCIYAFNTSNISSASYGGGMSGVSPRFGFSLDVFKTAIASEGYIIANWAYRLP